jgi:hypothetical protein
LPFTPLPQGYQLPFISCISRMVTGWPWSAIDRANMSM